MVSTHVDIENTEWTAGTLFYGPAAMYQGKDIVQLKILSDRRSEGGGIAWLAKFSPPPGKLIKIVATALSDEHVFNPKGQPHSALIGTETVSLVIYRGEPDEIASMEVIDVEP